MISDLSRTETLRDVLENGRKLAWEEDGDPAGPRVPGERPLSQGHGGRVSLQTVGRYSHTERKLSRLLVPKDLGFGEMRNGPDRAQGSEGTTSGHFRFVE